MIREINLWLHGMRAPGKIKHYLMWKFDRVIH
jgi:hypothetical protein